MDKKTFEKQINKIIDNSKNILISKGREYQNNKSEEEVNIFNNFERAAERLGLNRETVLLVYMMKHFDSISTFVKDLENKSLKEIEKNLSEPINGRLNDLINYCLILNSMIEDRRPEIKDRRAKEDGNIS